MISVASLVFTLVLFSELNSRLVTVASPTTKVEDGVIEQDGLSSLLGDDPMIEQVMVPPVYRGSLMLDNSIRDEEGNPKILIISVSNVSYFFIPIMFSYVKFISYNG